MALGVIGTLILCTFIAMLIPTVLSIIRSTRVYRIKYIVVFIRTVLFSYILPFVMAVVNTLGRLVNAWIRKAVQSINWVVEQFQEQQRQQQQQQQQLSQERLAGESELSATQTTTQVLNPFRNLLDGLSASASSIATSASTNISQAASQAASTFLPRTSRYTLRTDIYQNAGSNTVTAEFELPGLAKTDVDVSVFDGVLTVSAKRDYPAPAEGVVYHIQDRIYGEGDKKIQLPPGTKIEDLKASMENGLLTISFPLASERNVKKVVIE